LFETRGDRRVLAEVATQPKTAYAGVAGHKLFDDLPRPVVATIVD
jgi:hypothetical protein